MRHWISRLSLVVMLVLAGWTAVVDSQSGPISLDQGWTERERTWFYSTTQGSQLLPYSWYLALEQPGGGAPFNADHLRRYGYLENANRASNPDNLPLGFVKDLDQDQLGLTCAACHTNQLDFAGKTWRIDGAPTDADTWAFLRDLNTSLAETAASRTSDRFMRFAAKVSARHRTPAATLYSDLQRFSEYFTKFVNSSRTDDEWGRARLDAFGMIFNRATGIDLNDWNNTAKPNAPVSVPFLWDTHWHDVVQWNGSAPNTLAFQRLGRNVGEVLGVFATTDIKKTTLPPLYFKASARRANLLKIEHLLSTLRSPAWPVELGTIDKTLAAQGATLYDVYCVSCHTMTPRNRPLGRSKVSMMSASDIGTDLTMAMNAKNRRAKSGILDGVRMPLSQPPIPSELPSVELTFRLVVGVILAPPNWRQLGAETGADLTNLIADLKADQDPEETTANGRPKSTRDLLADLREAADQLALQQREKTDEMKYKARPLDGIWATAPYLHNGSVPNLAELLKPEKERPAKFYVGTRYFDPKNVGFTTLKTDGAFEFDTSKPGNRNTGHNAYRPTGGGEPHVFTDAERMALVEYLKTL
jgi:processive rubber oxygenase RoxA-like protein